MDQEVRVTIRLILSVPAERDADILAGNLAELFGTLINNASSDIKATAWDVLDVEEEAEIYGNE